MYIKNILQNFVIYAIMYLAIDRRNKMKKIAIIAILSMLSLVGLTGCGNKNVSGSLEEIMEKLYANIPEEERPMSLTNIEITDENVKMYLGVNDIEFEEALASEPDMSSIAHSVVLVRVKDDANIEAIKEKIEKNADPKKWLCVEAEEVEVESKGNLIILIMTSEANAEKIENSFNNL